MTAQPTAVAAAGGVGVRDEQCRCGGTAFPERTQMAAVLKGKLLPRRAVSSHGAGFSVLIRRQQRAAGGGTGRSRLFLFHHQRPILGFPCGTLSQRDARRIVKRPAEFIHFAALMFQQ